MKTWLLFDCHNIAWAAFHSTGKLSYGNERTGSIFGFFKKVLHLATLYNTADLVFCFDHGLSKRRELCPSYKYKRRTQPIAKSDQIMRAEFKKQLEALKQQYLNRIGFRNVFFHEGFEADDLIAAICKYSLPQGDTAVVVSTDKDLLQLLSPSIKIHAGDKLTSLNSFKREYGVSPKDWAIVKAMAGCTTDEVPGISGVGEKTACKFVQGTLPQTTKAYRLCVGEWAEKIIERNLKVVRLPYPDTPVPKLVPDCTTKKEWNAVMEELGMQTLVNQLPISFRSLTKGQS